MRLVLMRDGEDVVGFAPISLGGGVVTLAGDPDLLDHQDVALAGGREAELSGALIDFLLSEWDRRAEWSSLELGAVRADSRAAAALAASAQERGLHVEAAEVAVAPSADLPGTWDEFVASLGKKHRHELRRKIRRLEASGEVQSVTMTDPESLDGPMDDFFALMTASGPDKAAFLTPERRRLFQLLSSEAAARGMLRLSFLELDGRRVAGCLIFDFAGSHMLYNSGYDPAMSDLSVGLISKAYAVREAISLGRRRFDFLKGAERYKYSLGGQDRVINRLVITRR